MKITAKEIRLITDAIVDQVYDANKVNKQIETELNKAWDTFSKTKKWKDTLKILKLGKQLDGFEGITVKDFDFFELDKPYGSCTYKITTEEKAKASYKNWIRTKIENKLPQKFLIAKKVETLLTIKTLCGKDMEAIMDEIVTTIKKEFKL